MIIGVSGVRTSAARGFLGATVRKVTTFINKRAEGNTDTPACAAYTCEVLPEDVQWRTEGYINTDQLV